MSLTTNQKIILTKVKLATAGFDPKSVNKYWRPSYRALMRKGLIAQSMSGCKARITDAGSQALAASGGAA